MPSITETVAAERRALARRERATVRRILRAHAVAMAAIHRELDALTGTIDAAAAAGETINPDWLRRQLRYNLLLAQVTTEYQALARHAGLWIGADIGWAANAGVRGAERTLRGTLGSSFTRLNSGALHNITAQTLRNTSPLRPILDRLAPGAADRVADKLIEGVALGRNPNRVAADVARTLNADVQRVRTVARTEMLRAYRESTRATYREHGVNTWIWLSAADHRTCAACWAMHGRRFSTLHPMAAHPNCRCTMIPGVPGVALDRGADLFDRLPASQQQQVLGPAAWRAYRDGAVTLDDLVRTTRSPVWGNTRQRRSLASALGPADAARYYRP